MVIHKRGKRTIVEKAKSIAQTRNSARSARRQNLSPAHSSIVFAVRATIQAILPYCSGDVRPRDVLLAR